MTKEFLPDEIARMTRERIKADADLREAGSEIQPNAEGTDTILTAPGKDQERRLQDQQELAEMSWKELRKPEFWSELGNLKNLAAEVNGDYEATYRRYIETGGSLSNYELASDRLKDFVIALQKLLKVSMSTVPSAWELGIHPTSLFMAGSQLGENIRFSTPSNSVSRDEDYNDIVGFMVADGMSPKQIVDVLETKVKAHLFDVAKDLGKVV